jgi:hypothetical protein
VRSRDHDEESHQYDRWRHAATGGHRPDEGCHSWNSTRPPRGGAAQPSRGGGRGQVTTRPRPARRSSGSPPWSPLVRGLRSRACGRRGWIGGRWCARRRWRSAAPLQRSCTRDCARHRSTWMRRRRPQHPARYPTRQCVPAGRRRSSPATCGGTGVDAAGLTGAASPAPARLVVAAAYGPGGRGAGRRAGPLHARYPPEPSGSGPLRGSPTAVKAGRRCHAPSEPMQAPRSSSFGTILVMVGSDRPGPAAVAHRRSAGRRWTEAQPIQDVHGMSTNSE